ncbi:hypothetical protein Tsubulata_046361 [Turnera subulata]|uniref:NB-ARC domain-containing protein n=1 Tax=Turnera subulata TaxID=218843 RepID=A0A9Q0G125_9ROSI|nr:hypothetical protein Tsubulata_046361 [Turnera subulata]
MAELVAGAAVSALFSVLLEKLASPELRGFIRRGRKVDDQLLENLGTTMLAVRGLLNDVEEKQVTNPDVQRWLEELKDAAYKEKLLQLLLSQESNTERCELISIVGLGGIGKTTLAQLGLTKDILMSIRNMKSDDMTNVQLHTELAKALEGKRILLVLDDVWTAGRGQWEFLLKPFKSVAEGSKILVTTRDDKMASIKSATRLQLEKLEDDDSWLLFKNHAFGEEDPFVYPELNKIGRDIIQKCDGLPLALKALGGLLSCDRDALEWEKILKSSFWDQALIDEEILPALKLCYHYLPSHLKQCFAYCAIFPKDFSIDQKLLLHLWTVEENIEMEEIRKKYVQDLVSRSFLQQPNDNPGLLSMHDLVNDLARFVSGDFCCSVEKNDRSRMATEKIRYLSFDDGADSENVKEQIQTAKFLRILFQPSQYAIYGDIREGYIDLLTGLPSLRVFRLPQSVFGDDSNLPGLPISIGKFKHLRYINLSGWRIICLPDEVCNLYSLQTLILRDCKELEELPDLLGNLKKLRYFDLYGSGIVRLPASTIGLKNLRHLDIRGTEISVMTPQLGQLTKLVVLTDFFTGEGKSDSIAELGPLELLQGEFCIRNLENVVDPSHATLANLKGKKYIEKLELRWRDDGKVPKRSLPEQILEQLRPSTSLKALEVHKYPGVRFPNWLGEDCFSKLTSLRLNGGRHCSKLPALGHIVSVGPEFYGINSSNKKAFLSLEKLTFSIMIGLQQLMPPPILDDDGEVRAFPLLQELCMVHCPVLETTASIRFPFEGSFRLSKLSTGLYRAESGGYESDLNILLEGIESTVCLEELDISRCREIRSFELRRFKNLSCLGVRECPAFESLYCGDGEGPLTSLCVLRIRDCDNFISFPGQGLQAPNLRELSLEFLDALEELPKHMHSLLHSLTELTLSNCTKLRSFPEGGLPSSIQILVICGCDGIESSPEGEVLESFPEETLLPPSLNSLRLSDFRHLKSLDYKGLKHLSSLNKLKLYWCPELQSLPEEGLPSSLQCLKLSLVDWSAYSLKLSMCTKLRFLPEKGLPSSLQCLELWHCDDALHKRCQEQGGDWP